MICLDFDSSTEVLHVFDAVDQSGRSLYSYTGDPSMPGKRVNLTG
jgi:hypothetical protein